MKLKTIQIVREGQIGKWIYRITHFLDTDLAYLARVPVDSPYWSHGVIKQMWDSSQNEFVITIRVKEALFHYSEALKIIELMENTEKE